MDRQRLKVESAEMGTPRLAASGQPYLESLTSDPRHTAWRACCAFLRKGRLKGEWSRHEVAWMAAGCWNSGAYSGPL